MTDALRNARRDDGFSARARVVAWGGPGSQVSLDLDHLPDISAIVDAGFDVEAILSPPQALAMMLEAQRIDSRRSAIAAVALNAHGAAIGIVHHGQVVAARTFNWKLGEPFSGTRPELLERYLIISELAPHLQHLIALARPVHNVAVSSVMMCGNLPALRSLSMLLIEEMDMEVETLDSPDLVSPSVVPQPDSSAALQLAAAVSTSAYPPPPSNPGEPDVIDRRERDRTAAGASSLRQVAGSIAFVLFATWAMMQVAGSAPAASAFPNGLVVVAAAAAPAPAPSTAAPTPVTTAPATPPPPRSTSSLRPEATMGRLDPTPPAEPGQAVPRSAPVSGPPRPALPESREPLPRVEGIAIAGDRRLAILDGVVVAVGDRVGGRVVRRIDQNGVLLREASGRDVFVAIRTRKPPPGGA